MGRQDRETMISVLLDAGGPIPTQVIALKETKEAADVYAESIRATSRLIDDTIKTKP